MFVLTVGAISSQKRRGRGKSKGQVAAKRPLRANISVDVRMAKLSAPWTPRWVDGIDQVPPGRQCGFSYGRGEEDITRRCCALSCKTGNRPSGVGKRLQQPAGVTPSRRGLHNQTDSAADHTLASLRPGSHQLPVTAVSGATRKIPSHVQRPFFPSPDSKSGHPVFPFRFFSAIVRQTQPESREM